MRRIAFFGGSFDPPHRGHLAIAAAAADRLALDQVLFAPVGRQPLKEDNPAADFPHRYAMTALATEADPRFVPSLLDAPRSTDADDAHPNYTVETLTRLRASLAAESRSFALFTLLGADSWLEIRRWFQAPRLLALTDWIVAARPGFSLASAEAALPPEVTAERVNHAIDSPKNRRSSSSSHPECDLILHHGDSTATRVWFLPDLQENISATDLRAALHQGDVDREFLPASIWEYIRKTNIYSESQVPQVHSSLFSA